MKKQVEFSISLKELEGIIGAMEFWISGKADYDWAIPIWGQKHVENSITYLKTYLSEEISQITLIFSKQDIWDEFTGILFEIQSHCDNLPEKYWFIENMIYDRIFLLEERGELPENW
ncbi:MAG: hypothetical protein HKP49_00925 [Maribacter sp.]|nr:hypothetical protein [Maribacter sp.]